MGKKKKEAAAGEEGDKKGGKGKFIIIGVVAVALGAGGYMLGGGGNSAASAGSTTTLVPKKGCKVTTQEAPKTVVDLASMSVNLADGHYLRVSVSLALCDDSTFDPATGTFPSAQAKDIVITTLSGKKMEDLSTPAGRDAAKQQLIDGITEAYKAEVYTVFLSEFVMQ
jgi:flagellar protein FliL